MHKLQYYLKLIFYKLTAALLCYNYNWEVLYNELMFLVHTFKKFNNMRVYSNSIKLLRTYYGNYYFRDFEIDWLMISPAFERQDINNCKRKINSILKEKGEDSKIIFLDIGASLGKYTVEICKTFGNRIKTYSFEPDPTVFDLLVKNIKVNRLRKVTPKKVALSSKNQRKSFYFFEPMKMIVSFKTNRKITIETRTLDSLLLSKLNKNDTLFIKIDVEGHEHEVLKGMTGIIKKVLNIHVLVEDSGLNQSRSPLSRILKQNFVFEERITPYNSYWLKKHE